MRGHGVKEAGFVGEPDTKILRENHTGRWSPSNIPVRITRCTARKDDGSRCSAYPVKGEKVCVGHLRALAREEG